MIALVAAIVLMLLLAYLPGVAVLRSVGFSSFESACFAPVVSTFAYVALGVVFYRVGFHADRLSVILPVAVVSLAALVLRLCMIRRSGGSCGDACGRLVLFGRPVDGRMLAAALAFNALIAAIVFLGTLDGPDSFSQNYDMGHHLSQVMAMVQSGNWSTLDVTIDGVNVGGFYPSVLHVYAALLVSCTGISTAAAINAVMFSLFAVVFPLGMFAFGVSAFPQDKVSPFCCAAVSLLFPAFPWILIRFSALLANVAGFSLLPLALVLFMACTDDRVPLRNRVKRALFCIVAMGVISVAHPNTLFSAAVFLIPFCAQRIWDLLSREGCAASGKSLMKCVAVGTFLLACAVIWKAVHDLEAFRGVVEYSYTAKSSLFEAVAGVLLVRFRWFSANIPLALLVLCGVLAALRTKGCRWLVAAYLFAAIQLIVCSATDPCSLKSYLCGFWYNHDFRLMASFAIVAAPLAGFGLARIARGVERVVMKRRQASGNAQQGSVCQVSDQHSDQGETGPQKASGSVCERALGVSTSCAAVVGLMLALVCFPVGYSPSEGVTTRSLGQCMSKLYAINDWEGGFTIYHSEEREFVRKAEELIPEGALVMNFPYDGSAYAYGLDGLNTYFKSNATYSEEGSAEYTVETRLCDIAWDPEVRDAAKELGIEYVLQLDHGLGEGSSTLEREYSAKDWRGIGSIDGETEGFEEVLASGDMRIDRIK